MISHDLQAKISDLYTLSILGAREISDQLGVSMKQVYSSLKKSGVPRRTQQESNRIHFQNKKPSFHIKERRTKIEEELYVFSLAMYWCEGFQTDRASGIDFANSNPIMIQLFSRFLRDICCVDKRRLRCYLYCYSNQNTADLINYWSSIAEIPTVQFTKPYVRNDFRLDKINKMPYGLLHIRYADKRLLQVIKQHILNKARVINNGRFPERSKGTDCNILQPSRGIAIE